MSVRRRKRIVVALVALAVAVPLGFAALAGLRYYLHHYTVLSADLDDEPTGTRPPSAPDTPVQTSPPLGTDPLPEPDPLRANDAILQSLQVGELAFNSPDRMAVGETTVLHLVAALDRTSAEVKALVAEPGPVESAPVRIAPVMEARLAGGPGLEIAPLNAEEQLMSRDEPTQWRWNVTARQAGRHRLHLTLSAVLRVAGSERRRTLKTFDREIAVVVSERPGLVSPVVLAACFVVLAGGAAAAVWMWMRRRRRGLAAKPIATPQGGDVDVFVSYARADITRVQPLVGALQERGVRVWIDVVGIDGATRWSGEIAEAVRKARVLVVMGSRASFASEYVQREVMLAAEEGKPIIPVELESAPVPAALKLHFAGIQRVSLQGIARPEAEAALLRALHRCGVEAPGTAISRE